MTQEKESDEKSGFPRKTRLALAGSISRKFLVGTIALLVVLAVSGIFLTELAKTDLTQTLNKQNILSATQAIRAVDHQIARRLERIEIYAHYLAEKSEFDEANEEFASLSRQETETLVRERDAEWRDSPKNEVTPFMRSIIESELSDELREELEAREFYEEKYGRLVYSEIFATNEYGAIIAETSKTSDYDQADEEWWIQTREKGIYVGELEYDDSSGYYSVTVASAIKSDGGEFKGVLKATVALQELLDPMLKTREETTAGATHAHETHNEYLVTRDGKLVYSSENYSVLAPYAGWRALREDLGDHPANGEYKTRSSDGRETQVVYARSQGYSDFKGLGWTFVMQHDATEAFAPVNDLSNRMIAVIAALALLAVIINLYVSGLVAKPLRELAAGARELARGNFKTRVELRTGDEIEELGNEFNRAAAALERMDEEHKEVEAAKTRFLSVTSHELRSPMTPMKAQLQMLLQNYFGKLNAKQRESAEIVLRNTERLDKIILDILEISRIDAARLKFEFVKTDLAKPLKLLLEEMDGFAPEKKIKIVLRINGKLPVFECDPNRVMQVLRNLINNAKKFSPPNTTITITVAPRDREKDVLFSVKDEGIGISDKAKPRVFEAFFQGEQSIYRKYEGTGLGLAICKGIVESQGGKMWFESVEGKGTTFHFTIPLEPAKAPVPVKLLFGGVSGVQEEKIQKAFLKTLGPLGESEFQELKRAGLNREKALSYVDELATKKIFTPEQASEFKNDLDKAF